MLNEAKNAELDQAITMMNEFYPRAIKALYDKYQEEGFTEKEAFELIKIHILGLLRNS